MPCSLQGPNCLHLSLFFYLQLYLKDLGKFRESQLLSGKLQKLAFRELAVLELVFSVLVCLCIGLSHIL